MGYNLIHADLHFGNVLVDGDRLAVIDFDDCGFGWHPYELAVVLAGHPTERFDANFESLLRGYRRVRALLFFGTAVVGFNLMIDLVYGYLDPRVRYQ